MSDHKSWEHPVIKWVEPAQVLPGDAFEKIKYDTVLGLGFSRQVHRSEDESVVQTIMITDMRSGCSIATNRWYEGSIGRATLEQMDANDLLWLPDSRQLERPWLRHTDDRSRSRSFERDRQVKFLVKPDADYELLDRVAERVFAWFIWAQRWDPCDDELRHLFIKPARGRARSSTTELTNEFESVFTTCARTTWNAARLATSLRKFGTYARRVQGATECGLKLTEAMTSCLERKAEVTV